MLNDLNFGVKQKFNLKCAIDVIAAVVIFSLFVAYSLKHGNNPYESVLYLGVMILVFVVPHFFSKQWVNRAIRKSLNAHSESISQAANEVINTLASQRNIVENLAINSKNFASLVEKLRSISNEILSTSKNTGKQINQSISFSQKEHEAISTNAEKMLVLRQKIQMIAELILELSEHTQQIGSTISVVDDIAEQTNMLALNAAVEAARAGEHGKGFAVVAGEIRKLADESKQAITKITSLTSNIQYTTNSTVMATEEGSKEIESVVKDINSVSSNSEILLGLIGSVLESLELLNLNAEKQNSIIEKLNSLEEEHKNITDNLSQIMNINSGKLTTLSNLSSEIKNSVIEG